MRNLKSKYFFFLFTIISLLNYAQNTPFFKNFNISKYNSTNQNWDVSVANNGKVYVANEKGLLEYEGLNWKFYELPNKTAMRSVLALEDRIYYSSFEEVGYWKKNNKGLLFYTSLNDFITEGISTDEEFWQILPYRNGLHWNLFMQNEDVQNGLEALTFSY